MTKALIALILLAFAGVTALALADHGYIGIFTQQLQTWAGVQVLADLVIALLLFLVWMWRDARTAGRNPWPWLALTLASGSIGALLYLLLRRDAPHTVDR